ncbi:MAG TPA: GntR family transcriptional regulator [Pseudonocardiaceae bacterium]|nr:GntR family transcriptional regulator [Pseudonocardiaceae bacterium]
MQSRSHATTGLALYAQIAEAIAQDIRTGRLAPGDQLPAEGALEDQFGVSRITVRGAIRELVARDLVEIRRGRGTFVTTPKLTQQLTALTGFVEDMQAAERDATAELLGHDTVPADRDVAERLRLNLGTQVTRIRRVRLADRRPISVDETYLPLDIGRRIVTHDLSREPIFTLLEQHYDIPIVDAEYAMEAIAAPEHVAAALGVAPNSPIFLIERTSHSTGNTPIDYERLHYRGDAIRFVTRLSRRPPTEPTPGAAR